MLYLLDKNENLLAILSNESNEACPYYDATILEQLDGEHNLEFTVPANHDESAYVTTGNKVLYKDNDGQFQMFIIMITDENHDENLFIHATCEHIYYSLGDMAYVDGINLTSVSALDALTQVLANTGWDVGNVADLGLQNVMIYQMNPMAAINYLISVYGGELQFRTLFDNQVVTKYVDILAHRGDSNGRLFEYQRDLQSVVKHTDNSSMITAMYGFGQTTTVDDVNGSYNQSVTFSDITWTVANGNPLDKPAGQTYLVDPTAVNLYGLKFGQAQFSDETDPETLLEDTYTALQQANKPAISYELKVVDLESLTGDKDYKIRIGDTIFIKDTDFVPALTVTSRVVEIKRYPEEPDKTEITLNTIYYTPLEFKNNDAPVITAGGGGVPGSGVSIGGTLDPSNYPDTIPVTPGNVVATGGFKTISLTWTLEYGIYMANYEVYASQVQGFVPDATNLIFKGFSNSFIHKVDTQQQWYYRIRGVNVLGHAGNYCNEITAITTQLTDANDLGNAIITNALIANGSIDVAKIANGTILDAYINKLNADQITIGADTVYQAGYDPSAKASINYVNNFSSTKTNTGWTLKNPKSSAGAITFENVDFNGMQTYSMKLTSNGNDMVLSDKFLIDPNKGYSFSFWLNDSATTGNDYFGIYVFDDSGNTINVDHIDINTLVINSTNNPYFIGPLSNVGWINRVGFVLPNNIDVSKFKSLGTNVNSAVRLPINAKYLQFRFLSWGNTASRDIWAIQPAVNEFSNIFPAIAAASTASASDATTKANNAQSAAISAAASDATTKTNSVRSDLQLQAPLPTAIKLDNNGITAYTGDPNIYARMDYRGLYVAGGAIEIDGGLSDSNIASSGDWNLAASQISDMSSDGKLSPNEKIDVNGQMLYIQSEKTTLDSQADTYSITTEKTNYDNAYNTLNDYISPLLTDKTVTSTIDRTTFDNNFNGYYDAKLALTNKISAVIQNNASSAASTASSASSTANSASSAASGANNRLDGLKNSGSTTTIHGGNIVTGTVDANILKAGTVIASNITFTGTLSGVTGTFSGNLSGATGTFAGKLSTSTDAYIGNNIYVGGNESGQYNGTIKMLSFAPYNSAYNGLANARLQYDPSSQIMQLSSPSGTEIYGGNGGVKIVLNTNSITLTSPGYVYYQGTLSGSGSIYSGYHSVNGNLDIAGVSTANTMKADYHDAQGSGTMYIRPYSGQEVRIVSMGTTTSYESIRAWNFDAQNNVYVKGVAVQTSSATLKDNITPYKDDAIDMLKSVNIYRYHLKQNLENSIYDNEQLGALTESIPPLLRGDRNSTVNPYAMVSALWKACQQQQDLIEQLQKDINDIHDALGVDAVKEIDLDNRVKAIETQLNPTTNTPS